MIITEKSNKSDIIDAAVELTSDQAEQIDTLQQQVRFLSWIALLTTIWGVVF